MNNFGPVICIENECTPIGPSITLSDNQNTKTVLGVLVEKYDVETIEQIIKLMMLDRVRRYLSFTADYYSFVHPYVIKATVLTWEDEEIVKPIIYF